MLGAIDPDAIEECIAGQAVIAEAADRQRGKSLCWSVLGRPLQLLSKKSAAIAANVNSCLKLYCVRFSGADLNRVRREPRKKQFFKRR